MATVTTEIIPGPLGTFYRVSRVFPNPASAAAGLLALEQINADGFVPAALDAEPPPPPETVAARDQTAAYLREELQDDDEGAPGEPPRCMANGGCD